VGYRDAAMHWRLHGDSYYGLEIAAAKPPSYRTRNSLLMAGPALTLAATVIAYAAFFIDVDHDAVIASCDKPCFEHGRCTPVVAWRGLRVTTSCDSGGELACKRMRDCQELGKCSAQGGRCVAGSRGDCLPTPACKTKGRCTPRDGACHVGSDADCKQSEVCQQEGWCTPHLDVEPPRCGYGSDADCAHTNGCSLRGLCTHRQGRCVTGGHADCQQARYCKEDGLCSFDPERGVCFAKDDDDCKHARACTQFDKCHAEGDICRVDPSRLSRPE
jgi:hypothetical protein